MAAALKRISGAAQGGRNEEAEANPAIAHLFIINPLTGAGMDSLFSTHPATENRIAALDAMSREPAFARTTGHSGGPWG